MSSSALLGAARRMGFFALVQAIERQNPTAPRVGELGRVSEEVIRFRHDPSLGFSAADVSSVEEKDGVVEITTAFLGLTGSASPLPGYLAEEVAQEDAESPVRRQFLDVFHHRLLSMLYRNWSRGSGPREQTAELQDPWSARIQALMGMDVFAHPPVHGLPPGRVLRLAPLLAARARGSFALLCALEVMFEGLTPPLHFAVEEFAGDHARLEPASRFRLGTQSHALGQTTVLGSRVFERAGTFSLSLGPTTRDVYERFLPGGDLRERLCATVDLVLQDPLAYRLTVRLAPGEAPALRLGGAHAPRLGRDAWLGVNSSETQILVLTPARAERQEAGAP